MAYNLPLTLCGEMSLSEDIWVMENVEELIQISKQSQLDL